MSLVHTIQLSLLGRQGNDGASVSSAIVNVRTFTFT